MDDDLVNEILHVTEADRGVYFLWICYEEGDIAAALGTVYRTNGTRESGLVPDRILDTNDTLRTLWISPSGSLWVASADGNVATTANVHWPPPPAHLQYEGTDGAAGWNVTALPAIASSRLRPNVTALWGTDDDDVFAGCFEGYIYRWDGSAWRQQMDVEDVGGTIRAFGGIRDDVFAIGARQVLLHFDGQRWQRLRVPGTPDTSELFTAVLRLSDGSVLISGSSDEGRLLHGSAAGGLVEIGRYPIELLDMAPLGERVLFATGDGVAELIGHDVQMIRSTFMTATMSAGIGRVFFIEPAQEVPGFIEYDPRQTDDPWWGITY